MIDCTITFQTDELSWRIRKDEFSFQKSCSEAFDDNLKPRRHNFINKG